MTINLSRLEHLEILVVGDVMVDKYTKGDITRMSPEAPVPVVLVNGEHAVPGGAANVVNNLIALGAGVTVTGAVGDDNAGTQLMHLLQVAGKGNLRECLARDAGRVTTTKNRLVANGKQMARVDREMTHPIDEDIADHMFRMVGKLNQFNAIIVSDYGKGTITPYVFDTIMEQAQLFDVFVAVDPNGDDYSKYIGANIITPNLKEAKLASGKESSIEAASVIMEKAELPQLLITLGKDGMDLYEHSDYYHIETDAKEVFDVSGAGDTVIAAFTLAIAGGLTMREAAHFANAAAGIVVGKAGTATVSLEELKEEIKDKVVT
jgi:D-beta-D-heptose 7-phosphate kinase/D-beta-D-heptose 1-phosphate adenosyltransferase